MANKESTTTTKYMGRIATIALTGFAALTMAVLGTSGNAVAENGNPAGETHSWRSTDHKIFYDFDQDAKPYGKARFPRNVDY